MGFFSNRRNHFSGDKKPSDFVDPTLPQVDNSLSAVASVHTEVNELDRRKREIEEKIIRIQKSTRVTLPGFTKIHNDLRCRFRWYYNWHLNPWSHFVHSVALCGYIILLISISSSIIFPTIFRREGAERVRATTSVTVSNAGTTAVNGTYVENGTLNGRPKYDGPNGYIMAWDAGTFTYTIATYPVSTYTYWMGTYSETVNPWDESPWTGGRSGDLPMPNVSLSPSGITISGTIYSAEDKLSNIGANKTIGLSINGGAKTTAETTSGGAFEFTGVTISANQTVTLFIDDETGLEANLVTQAADGSTNITGLEMYTNKIVLRHETAGPMSNALLVTASGSGDDDVHFEGGPGPETFDDGMELYIATGMTYTPNDYVTADDYKIKGTFNAMSVWVRGDWDARGGSVSVTGDAHFENDGADKVIYSDGDAWGGNVNLTCTTGCNWIVSDAMDITGDLSMTGASTLNGSQNVTVRGGDISASGGSEIDMSGGTFNLRGTGQLGGDMDTWGSFYNLTVGDGSTTATTSLHTPGNHITVKNVFTIASSHTFEMTDSQSSTLILSGSGTPLVISGTFDATNISTEFSGSSTTSVAAATYSSILFTGGGTFNAAGNINATAFTLTSGTFNLSNKTLQLWPGTFTQSGGTFNANTGIVDQMSAAVTFNGGTFNGNSASIAFQNLDVNAGTFNSTSGIMWIGGAIDFTGTGSFGHNNGQINFAPFYITSNGQHFYDFYLRSGGGATLTDDLYIENNLTLESTIWGSGYNTTVGGNISGNADFGVGTLTIVDSSKETVISDDMYAASFTCITPDKVIKFGASKTLLVPVNFTVTGTLGHEITLQRSGGSGTDQWNINPTGTRNVDYVKVSDSNNIDATVIDATTGGIGIGTNNVNWSFAPASGISLSGTYNGSSGTIRAAINGTLIAQSTANAGSWTISGVTAPTSGQTVVVFVDGTSGGDAATAVTKYDGTGDITGISLLKGTVTIGSADNQTISNTDFGTYDSGDDSEILFTSASTQIINGSLTILASNTYAPDRDISINNSWTNSGTFSALQSTVTFTAPVPDRTITTNASSFNNIVFNGSGGGWTLQDDLTAATLTITDGTLTDNGRTVTVNGNITLPQIDADRLVSTGHWIMGANGNYTGTTYNHSIINILEIASGVTCTRTTRVGVVKKLILDANAVLGGSLYMVIHAYGNDALDQASGSNITSGDLYLYPQGADRNQKSLSISARLVVGSSPGYYIKMTGNWTVGNLLILGEITSTSEATASGLDTNGYNLTDNGNLMLGDYDSNAYYGKIFMRSGTHTIAGYIKTYNDFTETHGYIDFGTSTTSIGGFINLTDITVTPGTATVKMTATTAGSSIRSAGQSFPNLVFDGAGGEWTLNDNLTASSLTLTTGTLTDNGKTVTVNGDITLPHTNFDQLISTGRWIMGASGSYNGTYYNKNIINIFEIASGVTCTRTSVNGIVHKLVLDANAVLTGSQYIVVFATGDDPVDQGSGSNIDTGSLYIYPDNVDINQKSLNILSRIIVGNSTGDAIRMTGDWTTAASLLVLGSNSSNSEATASTLDTNGHNLTVGGDLELGYYDDSAYFGKILMGTGVHTITGNVKIAGSYTQTHGYIDFGSSNANIGGSIDFSNITVAPGTSTATLSATATGKTIKSAGQSFNNIIFNGVGGGWTLQDNMTAASITLSNGNLIDNGKTVTVNGNIQVDAVPNILTSTGTWVANANGIVRNISLGSTEYSLAWYANRFNILQISDGVHINLGSLVTGYAALLTKNLIVGSNCQIDLTRNYLSIVYPTEDNFLQIPSSSDISNGYVRFYQAANTTRNQAGFAFTARLYLNHAGSAIMNMTGDWSVGSLTIYGSTSSNTEAKANHLNTSGHNLTVNGNLVLGNNAQGYPNEYFGKLTLGSGTHRITGNISVASGSNGSHGYLDLGSSNLSVGGNINFTDMTVTPGSSTVTMNATTVGKTITSSTQSFNNLSFDSTGGGWALEDDLALTNLLITNGELDANGKTINLSGSFSSTNGTFKHNNSTVNLIGDRQSLILGSNTFYNLSSIAAGKNIQFGSGSTQTIENNLIFGGVSGNNITLARSGGSGADRWKIDPKGSRDISYVTVADSENINSLRIDPLSSINGSNNINWFTISGKPQNLAALAGNTSISLAWASPSDTDNPVTMTKIYRSLTADFVPDAANLLATITDPATQTYTDSDVENNVTYYYKLSSLNGVNNEGPPTDQVFAKPDSDLPSTPGRPSVTEKTNSDGATEYLQKKTIELKWEPSDDSNSGIRSYIVFIGNSSSGSEILNQEIDLSSFDNVNLPNLKYSFANEGTYFVRIQSKDKTDNLSAYSSELKMVIDSVSPEISDKFVLEDASDRGAQTYVVKISWAPAADTGSGILGYLIKRNGQPINKNSQGVTGGISASTDGRTLSYLDEVESDNYYTYSLQVLDRSLNLNTYDSLNKDIILPRDIAPVTQISDIKVTLEEKDRSKVTVSWKTSQEVVCKLKYGRTILLGLQADETPLGLAHSITLPSLVYNSTYYYQIYAYNELGTEAKSSILQFITNSELPKQGVVENVTSIITDNVKAIVAATATMATNAVKNFSNLNQGIAEAIHLPEKTVPAASSAVVVTTAGIAATAAPIANIATLFSLPEYLRSIVVSILSFTAFRKRKKEWGKIVEGGTELPISQARVDLIKIENIGGNDMPTKTVQTVYSDEKGGYAFLADPGRYMLSVNKDMFQTVETASSYKPNSIIEIKSADESLVVPNVVLSMNPKVVQKKLISLGRFHILEKITGYISLAILIFGTITVVSALVKNPKDVIAITMLCFYPFLWGMNVKSLKKISPFGNVEDANDHSGVSLALVRVMDQNGQKLIKTAVTDQVGKFKTLLNKGKYKVFVAKTGYKQDLPSDLEASEDLNVFNKKIEINKLTNS